MCFIKLVGIKGFLLLLLFFRHVWLNIFQVSKSATPNPIWCILIKLNFNDNSIKMKAMTDVKSSDLSQNQTVGNKKYILNKL